MRLRASALPGYNDCARRQVAKLFPSEVQGIGYDLAETRASVGALVGTTTHAVVRDHATAMRDEGAGLDTLLARHTATVAAAIPAFLEEVEPGVEWDDSTPNVLIAQRQIERMSHAFLPVLRTLEPELIEEAMEADLGDHWTLTGTLDCYSSHGAIDDWKTGALPRSYHAQLGGYVLLAKARGLEVREVATTFVERTRLRAPQRPAERQTYDVGVVERTAWATVQRIKREVGEFLQTGAVDAIPANPMSMMCNRRYCPAFGTSFCRLATEREAMPFDPSA